MSDGRTENGNLLTGFVVGYLSKLSLDFIRKYSRLNDVRRLNVKRKYCSR